MHSPAVLCLISGGMSVGAFLYCLVLADGGIKLLETSLTIYRSAYLEDLNHRHYSSEYLGSLSSNLNV